MAHKVNAQPAASNMFLLHINGGYLNYSRSEGNYVHVKHCKCKVCLIFPSDLPIS